MGVSPSLAGLEALRFGVVEARHRQVGLYAVRAWFLHPTYRGPDARWWRAWLADEAARAVYEAFETAMGGAPADLPVTVVAAGERADLALTRIVDDRRDLLVLGGRSDSRLVSWIVRSCMRGPAAPSSRCRHRNWPQPPCGGRRCGR